MELRSALGGAAESPAIAPRPRAVASVLAVLASFFLVTAAAAQDAAQPASTPAGRVWVAPSHVDRELDAVAEGHAELVRQQISRMGVSVVPGPTTRQAMAPVEPGSDGADTFRELAPARRTGASLAVLIDLRSRAGFVELDVRVYELAERNLVAGAIGVGTLATLAETTNPVLLQILPSLEPSVEGSPPSDGLPDLDQIAAATRAMKLADTLSLADAWRELEGMESPYVSTIRKQIQAASTEPGISLAEHARFVIAQGRASAGWQMIVEGARDALSSGASKDVPLMLAAGEAKLALGDAQSAEAFFEKSVTLSPKNPSASLGLARAHQANHKPRDARREFERAASLAPSDVRPLEALASISSTRSEKAGYYLEAGRRSSQRLHAGEASVNLERAAELDPTLAPKVGDTRGELLARAGDHRGSMDAYRQAITVGKPTAERLRGVARAQTALRDTEGAEATYLEVLKLDHNDVGALRDLGVIYTETGDPSMAVVRLERAQALDPADANLQRALANALHKRGYAGDFERAKSLHDAANERAAPTAEDLHALAKLQRSMGDEEAAVATLERALLKRHLSMYTRQELAQAYEARGDHQSATAVLQVVHLVTGDGSQTAEAGGQPTGDEAVRFDALLDSFAGDGSYQQQVAFLGLGTGRHWRDLLVEYLHPRRPNMEAIETGLLGAIDRTHTLVGIPVGAMDMLGAARGDLFRFDHDVSRSAELITFANLTSETDAVFLGRVLHPLGSIGAVDACGRGQYYVLELRKLGGQTDTTVSLLANRACVEAGWGFAGSEAGYSTWNLKAIPAWVLLVFALLWPLIRGWGQVQVFVRTPQHGRALFSVSISRRPKKFKEDKKDSAAPAWRFEKRLQSSGSGRRLKGNSMKFSFVAARRKPYYVTVRGPLLDLATDKLIGEFLEEKTVRVRPWRTAEVKFQMRTETAAITVKPFFERNGEAAAAEGEDAAATQVEEIRARVALKGDPSSVRFTSGGQAYVYAPPGNATVVVGAVDRVVEIPLEIAKAAPIDLPVDLTDFDTIVFVGCEAAVTPYVECDYAAAADALEAAGDNVAAQRVRAMDLSRKGQTEEAAKVLESAGMHAESVSLRMESAPKGSNAESGVSGALLEQAGDHSRAGQAFEAEGDLVSAARNYEAAYEYQNALDCYETLEDVEKVLSMLEAMGDVYEAGKRAAEATQIDRAIANLQQVDQRHGHYSEACRLLAEMLTMKGEVDVAVEKYSEAMGIWGSENAPLDMQQSYAELLEQADRELEALQVYESIRKRDVHFGDVATRIEVLKKSLSNAPNMGETQATVANPATTAGGTPKPQIGDDDSRYEIIEELGRGGMGVVFRARDRHLGRVVALKVLPDNLRQHPQAVKLFLREARAAAALNHQNIVTLFDAGQEGDAYFLTMECLEGAGLETILASRGPLSTKAAATVGLQVAAGLDYAQRSKIVHRDIKPSNLFLTRDRTVKIMDFGLAKMVEEVRRGSTVIGGTPNFMAPEQAQGGSVDHRTDLYALGGTLFELVTGTVPYESGDVVYHHVHTPPPDARERNVDVPAPMAELILELMAKNPDERIQSARDLAARLQQILKG